MQTWVNSGVRLNDVGDGHSGWASRKLSSKSAHDALSQCEVQTEGVADGVDLHKGNR